MVEVRSVSQRFAGDRVLALDRVDLAVPDGQFVAVVGPSGCGKSTLLLLVAGLRQPSSGAVLCDGEPMTAPMPRIRRSPEPCSSMPGPLDRVRPKSNYALRVDERGPQGQTT